MLLAPAVLCGRAILVSPLPLWLDPRLFELLDFIFKAAQSPDPRDLQGACSLLPLPISISACSSVAPWEK